MSPAPITISRRDFDAVIFDLDGVLTDTARLHAVAWKTVFDELLHRWGQRHGQVLQPFDITADYLAYVDGLPRQVGIHRFLTARGINLPEGSERDPEGTETVYALGARKTRLFRHELEKGVAPAEGAALLLEKLRRAGVKRAVSSSSKNAGAILRAAGLENQFDVCVDGLAAEALGIPGKPDPALFLETARRLGAQPARTILFEDALAGVEAGRRGAFGCVVGVDHSRQKEALIQHGADVVIQSLREVEVSKTR
jgi:alpha,alpha-trehalase